MFASLGRRRRTWAAVVGLAGPLGARAARCRVAGSVARGRCRAGVRESVVGGREAEVREIRRHRDDDEVRARR
eukprot:12889176-Heterocapsa_arctica.AAC.1